MSKMLHLLKMLKLGKCEGFLSKIAAVFLKRRLMGFKVFAVVCGQVVWHKVMWENITAFGKALADSEMSEGLT